MRIAGVVAAGVLVVSGIPFEAFACSCEPPPSPNEALGQSVAVFSGTVTRMEEWATANDGLFFKVTLVVQERWAGPSADEIAIVTATDEARCGYAFAVGNSYLVYAHGFRTESERLPATGLCTRTLPLEEAQDDLVALRRSTAVFQTLWGRLKALAASVAMVGLTVTR